MVIKLGLRILTVRIEQFLCAIRLCKELFTMLYICYRLIRRTAETVVNQMIIVDAPTFSTKTSRQESRL